VDQTNWPKKILGMCHLRVTITAGVVATGVRELSTDLTILAIQSPLIRRETVSNLACDNNSVAHLREIPKTSIIC